MESAAQQEEEKKDPVLADFEEYITTGIHDGENLNLLTERRSPVTSRQVPVAVRPKPGASNIYIPLLRNAIVFR